MDKALRDAVGALQISRPHLGIFTAEKGLLAGRKPGIGISLKFFEQTGFKDYH